MPLFTGHMKIHMNGHKELTEGHPVITIPAPDKVYIPLANMTATDVEMLVKEGDQVRIGTKVAVQKSRFSIPLFASVSGTVGNIEKRIFSDFKMVDHLVINNDGRYDREAVLPKVDWQTLTAEAMIDYIKTAGIVGCGGAGFPTYVKYMTSEKIETVIINAVECEPYLTTDCTNISENMDDFITGCRMMSKMARGARVIIAIKSMHKELVARLQKELAGNDNLISVCEVRDFYPLGWERLVVKEVLHQEYKSLPSEVGAIVNNATTCIAVAQAFLYGWPITEKLITFAGEGLKTNAIVKVKVGTPITTIIDALGGYTSPDVKIICGGPMMGTSMANDQLVVNPHMNGVIIRNWQPHHEMACLHCGRCADYCPRGLEPVRINLANKAKDMNYLKQLKADTCIECGTCSYVCPSHLPITEYVRRAKRNMKIFGSEK